MSDGVVEMDGTDSWSGLLEETRQALSMLRVEDLGELSTRAQKMFDAAAVIGTRGQRGSGLGGAGMEKMKQEHRLLGDLLLATDKNLQVLRRLQCRLHSRVDAGEGNVRWVR